MTTIPQQTTVVQYTANSAQTEYTFAFYAPFPTDIVVYYQASDSQPVPDNDKLVYNTDYTVSFNSDPITGGTITLLFTPTSGYYLTINRDVEASLTTNFTQAANFNGANLDTELNRLLLLIQQNKTYCLERNLSYIINTYLPNAVPFTQLPPLGNQQIWIGTGEAVTSATLEENPDVSTLRSELANAAPLTAGARLVGYYDQTTTEQTTVNASLDYILQTLTNIIPQLMPPGMMIEYAGTATLDGFLLADGSAVAEIDYPDLYSAIGTTWNTGGEGAGNFRLPDTRRRVGVGSGGSATSPAFAGTTPGSYGGEEVHTATTAETAPHTHNVTTTSFGASGASNVRAVNNFTDGTTQVDQGYTTNNGSGSATPFNVMQLGYVVTKQIKY